MSGEILNKKEASDYNNYDIQKDEDDYVYIDRHNVGILEGAYFVFMIFFSQIMWKLFRIKM
tara:strand:+ start:438 stop:620 length:183 start_codon:yes stop_codon:yes gene_type:complete